MRGTMREILKDIGIKTTHSIWKKLTDSEVRVWGHEPQANCEYYEAARRCGIECKKCAFVGIKCDTRMKESRFGIDVELGEGIVSVKKDTDGCQLLIAKDVSLRLWLVRAFSDYNISFAVALAHTPEEAEEQVAKMHGKNICAVAHAPIPKILEPRVVMSGDWYPLE